MSRIPRSEEEILALLDGHFPREHASLLLGRGDDCAVVRGGGPWAVTCDAFLEDAHFRRRYFSPSEIGHKALAVNLSDLAAQGARPRGFVMSLTLNGREDEAWLHEFAGGMSRLAARYGVILAGGDLARSVAQHISITAWGELEGKPGSDLRRGKARKGDIVFVVGTLGLARVGLRVLETARSPEEILLAREEWPVACGRHLRPEPEVEPGLLLARLAGDSGDISLMDVSDGLARDLPRLLASSATGLGADLALPEKDLPGEVLRYAACEGLDAALFAYEGGEDYALAGTCPPERWPELERALAPRIKKLGEVTGKGFVLNGIPRSGGGFDHFGRSGKRRGGHCAD
jgi:thiamine-monophosphate kinase